jgi:hypothetical protein
VAPAGSLADGDIDEVMPQVAQARVGLVGQPPMIAMISGRAWLLDGIGQQVVTAGGAVSERRLDVVGQFRFG